MVSSSGQAAPANPDYGQHWKDAARVQQYVSRTDQREAERAGVMALVADLAPFEPGARVRILDIGSGHGPFASALLDAFPNGTAVGLDMSDAMMAVGRERMARFGDRFTYHVGEFTYGRLPAGLPGPFDIAVSAAAIHHLPPEHKQAIYKSIAEIIRPGGCFFNLDTMNPTDPFILERYRAVSRRQREREGRGPGATGTHQDDFGHWFDPVEDHLAWLRDAGFTHAGCFWHKLGRALIGGFK